MGTVCGKSAAPAAASSETPTTGAPAPQDAADTKTGTPDNDNDDVEEFFDTREIATESMMYPPASIANPYPPSRVILSSPSTLLAPKRKTLRRATVSVRNWLQNEPRGGAGQLRGYPGELNQSELDACLEFRKQLPRQDPAFQEVVDCFQPVEEEPYALCRFMRARNFDPQLVLEDEGLVSNWAIWRDASHENFYPSVDAAVGCPASVFITQYPSLYYGHAKNGCPVGYFMAGRMQVEGVECVTTLDQVNNYMWYSLMHQFKGIVAASQKTNPDSVVRCEAVSIIDLKGLSSSQINSTSLGVLQKVVVVTRFFPEMLNHMVITNAPYFFSLSWPMIKGFLDARTSAKIDIFSNPRNATKKLKELIDSQELLQDLGGTGPSFDTAAFQEGNKDGGAKRQEVQLMHVTANSSSKWNFELANKEKATVTIYTRSFWGAVVTISKNSTEVVKQDVTNPNAPESPESSKPYNTYIGSDLQGPGKLDLTITSPPNSTTTDHFLVHVQVFQV